MERMVRVTCFISGVNRRIPTANGKIAAAPLALQMARWYWVSTSVEMTRAIAVSAFYSGDNE